MSDTGGLLNILNEKKRISSVRNSVPVMKLINIHKPKSRSELVELIEYHYLYDCPCGIKSKGTVEDFGRNLYDAQLDYWGEYKFSLEECIRWEYDLFITNSLKGAYMESKAVKSLSEKLPSGFTVSEVDNVTDVSYRVDLEVYWFDSLVFGVQVKPLSYVNMEYDVKQHNIVLNNRYSRDVRYLYYDDNEEFVNIDDVVGGL